LRVGSAVGVLVLLAQGLAMMPANALPDASMAWTQRDLSLKVYEGTSNSQSLDLTISGTVTAPGVTIDGNLRDVATVDVSAPTITSAGHATVTMTINLPAQSKDSYVGNIQLTDNGRRLPQPLHVAVQTAHWDATTIPADQSTPSPDRVGDWLGQPVVVDQLMVGTPDGLADPDSVIRKIAAQYGGQITGSLPGYGLYELRIPGATVDSLNSIRDAIAARPDVDMATHTMMATEATYTDDSVWKPSPGQNTAQNWNLQQIDAPGAWDESTGAGISVGIIDGGFYTNHEDIKPNIQSLTVLSSGSEKNHGTHVAGTACGTGNNGKGIVGVAFNCRLILDELDLTTGPTKSGSAIDRVMKSLDDMGKKAPRVVNASLGWATQFDCTKALPTDDQANQYNEYMAYRKKILPVLRKYSSTLWVFSAGNEEVPAQCAAIGGLGDTQGLDNVVTVAASTKSDSPTQAHYSNYGAGVTVAAPGGETSQDRTKIIDGVYSSWSQECTWVNLFNLCPSTYDYDSGTSMAAPHVTGTAALAFGANGALLPGDVKRCLIAGAAAGGKQIAGQSYSIINAKNTVGCALGKLGDGPLTNVARIIPGSGASFALKKDGTVWAWGTNYSGELGNGTTDNTPKPKPVVGLSGVADVAAGAGDTYALKKDGSLWAWGANDRGQLGNGTSTSSSTPIQVPGLPPIVSVSAQGGSAYAVGNDGSVWTWGNNFLGVLGNGTTNNALSPVRLAVPEVARTVYAGLYTAYVLTDRGTVWSWGDNGEGQLGNGTTTASHVPVQVAGLSGATRLVMGGSTIYAIMPDQTLKVWGEGDGGGLGNGALLNSSVPVTVPNVSPVSQVASTPGYAFARLDTGTVLGWGNGWDGALGNGSTSNTATPTAVSGISSAIGIATCGRSSFALMSDGTVRAWGMGALGAMGNGTMTESNPTPVTVNGLTGVVSIVAGSDAAYAIRSDGSVWSWGANWAGQLGRQTTGSSATPAPM
jgi:alpha-tubulin suppressor-like RCC1 family protein